MPKSLEARRSRCDKWPICVCVSFSCLLGVRRISLRYLVRVCERREEVMYVINFSVSLCIVSILLHEFVRIIGNVVFD